MPVGLDDVQAVVRRESSSGGASSAIVAVADQHVAGLVETGARVQHVAAADQQVAAGWAAQNSRLVLVHHATAARTGEPTSSS